MSLVLHVLYNISVRLKKGPAACSQFRGISLVIIYLIIWLLAEVGSHTSVQFWCCPQVRDIFFMCVYIIF